MKVTLGAVPLIYPVPIILAGTLVEGVPNFTTLGDVGLIGIRPPLVVISSHVAHHTNKGILAHGTFSINMPSTALLAEVDFCGQVSGRDMDKSALFDVFYGELETAPLIQQCPVNIECRVVKEFCIEHRQVFVGQVVQTHASAEFVTTQPGGTQRIAAATDLDPILYALDNRYYRVGDIIGTGYQEADALKAQHTPGKA